MIETRKVTDVRGERLREYQEARIGETGERTEEAVAMAERAQAQADFTALMTDTLIIDAEVE